MASAKVVGIHGVKPEVTQSAAPLPKELIKLRELGKERVRAFLIELFNNADDALFAMADKAGSNNDQAVYFEAMRELRLKKKHIVLSTLGPAVRSFLRPSDREETQVSKAEIPDLDQLSLVDHESLEFDVAVEGMVQRLRNTANNDLKALRARVEVLWGLKSFEDADAPLSPELLCQSFMKGCSALEADIRAKLTVLKLFERYVLVEMPSVYAELNQTLVSGGILPEYTHLTRKAGSQSGRGSETPASATDGKGDASSRVSVDDVSSDAISGTTGEGQSVGLDTLRQLLHPQGKPVINANEQSAQSFNGTDQQVQKINQNDILHVLSLFQNNDQNMTPEFVSENHSIDFQALLGSRLSTQDAPKQCNALDADMINLVSMLFEFILDDRQLQAEMKAIISRLQIPILKVALLDKSFFNKGGHPARKLLNEIASSAIGWNPPREGRRDRFKENLESLVERVTEGFAEDVSIFDSLLEEFQSFVDAERRRGLLVEQRTRDSEKGKAAAHEARKAAQEVINAAVSSNPLPDLGLELLRDAWSSVLVFKYLREGEQSEGWKSAVNLVDELVWSLCPDPNEPEARTKLLKLIPSLVQRLRTSFDEVALDEVLGKRLLTGLEEQHVLSLQALQQQIDLKETALALGAAEPEAQDVRDQDRVGIQDDEVSDLIRSTLELEEDFKQLQETCEQSNEKSQSVEAQDQRLPKKQENIVLVEEQPAEENVSPELNADSPFVQQVDRFVVGCWFEFVTDKGAERCKLAAIIRSTGKHVFVNRAGVKVYEKKKLELAKDLSDGLLQVMNDGLLFDRALESIITNLRS